MLPRGAVSKRLKALKVAITKDVTLFHAGEIVEKRIDLIEQLQRINDSANEILSQAMRRLRGEKDGSGVDLPERMPVHHHSQSAVPVAGGQAREQSGIRQKAFPCRALEISTPEREEITMSADLCRECEKAIQECERHGQLSLPLTYDPFPFKEARRKAPNLKEVFRFAWDDSYEVKPGSYYDWFISHYGKKKGIEFCFYGEVMAELMERSDCIDCSWVNEDDYHENLP